MSTTSALNRRQRVQAESELKNAATWTGDVLVSEMNEILPLCASFVAEQWLYRLFEEHRCDLDAVLDRLVDVARVERLQMSVVRNRLYFGLDDDAFVVLTDWSEDQRVRMRAVRMCYALTCGQDFWTMVDYTHDGRSFVFRGFKHDLELDSEAFTLKFLETACSAFLSRVLVDRSYDVLVSYVDRKFTPCSRLRAIWTTTTSSRAAS